jgi:hypothetical protein
MKKIKLLLAAAFLSLPAAVNAQMYVEGDITMMHSTSATHDSTECHTVCNSTYQFTIANSSMSDTIWIIDQTGQNLIMSEANTMGQSPWTVTLPAPMYPFQLPDHQIMSGMAMFNGPLVKIIVGDDTIYNVVNSYQLPVTNPCEYGPVSGKVFADNNNDCQYNTGDDPLNQINIISVATLSNTTGVSSDGVFSDMNGDYTIPYVQKSWVTSYTVSMPGFLQFIFPPSTCNPGVFTFTTVPQSGVDFALQCSGNVDMQAYAAGPANIRPNDEFVMAASAANVGCDQSTGTLTLVVDPEVTVDQGQINPTPDYISTGGDTLKWNYANLTNIATNGFWNSFISSIHMTPDLSLNIGDSACFRVYTDIPVGDVNVLNNDYSFCLPVVNSYDPNAKEVSPKGEGVTGGIPPSTDYLTYTVHFQNTGNAVAYNVQILDTLDADVDPASLKIIATSHNMTPEWVSPGVARFNFYNIMLPDSNSNEPESHGFVTYRVNLDQNLTIGTQIKNTAHIYFDFNTPITTNTTLNTIAWPQNVVTLPIEGDVITLYPNPANDHITISSGNDLSGTASVVGINGQVISTVELKGNSTGVDVSKLPNGIYIMKVVSKTGTTMQKFTKQ